MNDLERAVGRLEGEIKSGFRDLAARIDRMHRGVFDDGGIEPRLRDVEYDMREIKTKAGLIATGVSIMVAFGARLVKLFFSGW